MDIFAEALKQTYQPETPISPLFWMTYTYPDAQQQHFYTIANTFANLIDQQPDLAQHISYPMMQEIINFKRKTKCNSALRNLSEDTLHDTLFKILSHPRLLNQLLESDKNDFTVEIMLKFEQTPAGKKILILLLENCQKPALLFNLSIARNYLLFF